MTLNWNEILITSEYGVIRILLICHYSRKVFIKKDYLAINCFIEEFGSSSLILHIVLCIIIIKLTYGDHVRFPTSTNTKVQKQLNRKMYEPTPMKSD